MLDTESRHGTGLDQGLVREPCIDPWLAMDYLGMDSRSLQEMLDVDIKCENEGGVIGGHLDLGFNFNDMSSLGLDDPVDTHNDMSWFGNSASLLNGNSNSSHSNFNLDLNNGDAASIMVNPNSVMPHVVSRTSTLNNINGLGSTSINSNNSNRRHFTFPIKTELKEENVDDDNENTNDTDNEQYENDITETEDEDGEGEVEEEDEEDDQDEEDYTVNVRDDNNDDDDEDEDDDDDDDEDDDDDSESDDDDSEPDLSKAIALKQQEQKLFEKQYEMTIQQQQQHIQQMNNHHHHHNHNHYHQQIQQQLQYSHSLNSHSKTTIKTLTPHAINNKLNGNSGQKINSTAPIRVRNLKFVHNNNNNNSSNNNNNNSNNNNSSNNINNNINNNNNNINSNNNNNNSQQTQNHVRKQQQQQHHQQQQQQQQQQIYNNNNINVASGVTNGAITLKRDKAEFRVDLNDFNEKFYPKPAYSYSCLIAMALKNSQTGSLPVSEIYNFMCEHFPYFKTAPNGWKNSVRHNLSLNKCFEKIEKPAGNGNQRKGCLWAINPTKVTKMDEEVLKWSRKDPLAIKKAMIYPDHLELLERGEMKYAGGHGGSSTGDLSEETESSGDENVEENPTFDSTTKINHHIQANSVTDSYDESSQDDDIDITEQIYDDIDIDENKDTLHMQLNISKQPTFQYDISSPSNKRQKTAANIQDNFIYQSAASVSRRKTPTLVRTNPNNSSYVKVD